MSEPRRPSEGESSPAASPPAAGQRWIRLLSEPQPSGWADVLVALALAALYTALLLGTLSELGYARDEGFYFSAARAYGRWFDLLWSDPSAAFARVDAAWQVNHEHPALVKSLFGLSHLLTYQQQQLFELEGTSFRFPAMVLSALGVGLVYLWGTRASGRLVGVVAAVSLGAMPRFFFHAHLACFDGPVVTMWTLCAYAYWRALGRGGWLWPIVVGITFGLALNTKHNSWFLPIVCGAHAGLLQLRGLVERLAGRRTVASRRAFGLLRRRAALALLAMATIGPVVFYGLWPWIWHDTLARLQAYARFHLHHVYYNMEFLGENYFQPPMPRSYAFVMTVATVPTITLLLCAIGLLYSARRDLPGMWRAVVAAAVALRGQGRRDEGQRDDEPDARGAEGSGVPSAAPVSGTALLWLLAMAVQFGAWLLPSTPIFGGTKHWMTAYPFVVLFAGVGLAAAIRQGRSMWASGAPAARWLQRLSRGPWLEGGFALCVLGAPVVEAWHAHPWGLSSYVPLVGGAAGGANLGLNRGFWGYTTGAVAEPLNRLAPDRGRVFLHDTANPAWDMLRRDGRVRRDLRGTHHVVGADLALYHHEKHMAQVEYQNWVAFGTTRPAHVAGLDGVPVVWIYQSPQAAPSAQP